MINVTLLNKLLKFTSKILTDFSVTELQCLLQVWVFSANTDIKILLIVVRQAILMCIFDFFAWVLFEFYVVVYNYLFTLFEYCNVFRNRIIMNYNDAVAPWNQYIDIYPFCFLFPVWKLLGTEMDVSVCRSTFNLFVCCFIL